MRRFLRVLADVVIVALLTTCFCYYRETRAQFRMTAAEDRALQLFCREIKKAPTPELKMLGALRLYHFVNGLKASGARRIPFSTIRSSLGDPDEVRERSGTIGCRETSMKYVLYKAVNPDEPCYDEGRPCMLMISCYEENGELYVLFCNAMMSYELSEKLSHWL